MQIEIPEGWVIQRLNHQILKLTAPDGSFLCMRGPDAGESAKMDVIGEFMFSFFDAALRETAALEVARKTTAAWGDGVYVNKGLKPDLEAFLDHAAGEGYEFRGVDAQKLYLDIFGAPTG